MKMYGLYFKDYYAEMPVLNADGIPAEFETREEAKEVLNKSFVKDFYYIKEFEA